MSRKEEEKPSINNMQYTPSLSNILRSTRERTWQAYMHRKEGRITDKELGRMAEKDEVYFPLIQVWKKEEENIKAGTIKGYLCCFLCIKKGKRCICRKSSSFISANVPPPCHNCHCPGCA